ncbi:3701_t:CDS:1, partial [Acaulospora morrowiae]
VPSLTIGRDNTKFLDLSTSCMLARLERSGNSGEIHSLRISPV